MPGYAVVEPEIAALGPAPDVPTSCPPRADAADDGAPDPGAARPAIKLRRGDIVAFTGQMRVPREIWENRAVAAGLVPYPAVTPRVRLVVAGNPAALSGKALAALELGIPVITEEEFGRLVAQRRRRP